MDKNTTNINCPKCGNTLTAESSFCNKCGAKLIKQETKKEKRFWEITKNIFEHIWDFIENIWDFLTDIPVIGCFLSAIFALLCVGLVGFAGIMILVGLFSIHYILGFIVLLVGMDVIAYFASFKWGMRKPWFFWAALVLSILALLFPLFME